MIKTYRVLLSIVGMLAAPSVSPAQSVPRDPIVVAQAALDVLVKRHSTRHIVLEPHTEKRTELDRMLSAGLPNGATVSAGTSGKWTVSFKAVDYRSDSIAFVMVHIRSASTPACIDEVPIVMGRTEGEWQLQLWLNSRRQCNGPS
jgi:hypothetical protein